MKNFLKTRWALLVVLLVFIICKIPHLYYPFFWDESWVYAPAVMQLYAHGVSLLPSSLDVGLSRGHPLFFHAACATWIHVFGHSHFSMHCFALLISVLLIIAVYEVALRLFNARVATISIVLLVLQVPFFVNSSFVLPEMMVSLFVLLGLYYYTTERYFMTALFLTLLFYTKESGLVLGVVLGIDAFISLFNRKIMMKQRLLKTVSVLIPAVLIAVFFVIQKKTYGWYVYPEHVGDMNFDVGRVLYWFRHFISVLFHYDNKYWFYFVLFLVSVIAAIKQKSIRYLALMIPAVLVYFFDVNRSYKEFACILMILLFLWTVGYAVHWLLKVKNYNAGIEQKFIILSVVFFMAYLYFCTVNYYEPRYLFCAMVVGIMLVAVFFDVYISKSYPILYYPVLALLFTAGAYCFITDRREGVDTDLGAFAAMDVQQSVVDYFEKNNLYDKNISSGTYQEVIHLNNPNSGYLRYGKIFTNVHLGKNNPETEYVIFDNIEPDDWYKDFKKDTNYTLVFTFKKENKWAEVYKRK